MKFESYNFHPQLKENLTHLSLKKPTDIQYRCIAPILKGDDLFAVAHTGTGKTLAFAIPLVNLLCGKKSSINKDKIKVLVVVPTRELALQIQEVFNAICKSTKVKVCALIGGVEQSNQEASLAKGVDVVIATPGRLFDLINQKKLSCSGVEYLVLDEADRMLEPSFIKDILYIKKLITQPHQTLFFSATINPQIKKLAFSVVSSRAIHIQISPKDPISKNVRHKVIFINMEDKGSFLSSFITENSRDKIVVFVRTKVRASRVVALLNRSGIEASSIHGDLDQSTRTMVIKKFKEAENGVLVATDVTARGIDIPNLPFVINYDLPEIPENYVHRVGRTGRAFSKGIALSFCANNELPLLEKIEEYIGKKIILLEISKKNYSFALSDSPTAFAWAPLLEEEFLFLEGKKKKVAKATKQGRPKKSSKKSGKKFS